MRSREGRPPPVAGKSGPGLAALAACLAVSAAFADPFPAPATRASAARSAAVAAWDCWVDTAESGGIRCIADRDVPAALPEDYSDDDEAAEVLLELVHDNLHRGRPLRASELVREKAFLLRREDLWTIRLNAPPYETSWAESRPQVLVRSLLCRGRPDCRVRLLR